MNRAQIERILKRDYIGCSAEECWNGCSSNDEHGYIDVAIAFKTTEELKDILGEHLSVELEEYCWIWACSDSKGGEGTKYRLVGMETDTKIDGRSSIAKAIRSIFGNDVIKAKKDYYEYLKEER